MHGHDDAQLVRRIRHQVSRHQLQPGAMQIIQDDEINVKCDQLPELYNVVASGTAGLPVLLIIDSEERWTIVGTHGIVSKYGGSLYTVVLDQICDCNVPADSVEGKGRHEYLQIVKDDGLNMSIWIRSGAVYYAIWNILLMLIKMRKR
jgi:hypothetical protein